MKHINYKSILQIRIYSNCEGKNCAIQKRYNKVTLELLLGKRMNEIIAIKI